MYLPAYFEPSCSRGTSLIGVFSSSKRRGRTVRERAKQARRFDRIRGRSDRDLAGQKTGAKK